MAVDLIKRDTTANIVGSIQNDLTTTTGTGATLTYGRSGAGNVLRIWGTTGLGITDWDNGTYTWRYRVVTANTNYNITLVRLIRYASDGTTEIASKSSGAISVSCGTTGVKSGTIAWSDGTQNPAGRVSSDRFAIEFTLNTSACGTQNIGVGVNLGSTNDEISTPLTLPTLYDRPISESSVSVSDSVATNELYVKPISEPSVSVSESLDDTETYVKPISESSVSVSGSVEANKILASGAIYDVHFVEFPEEVTDEILAVKQVAGEQVTRTTTHKFDIIGKITKSTTHKYHVEEKVTTTKTHKFNIVTAVTATKTHLYNIIEKITQTKTHKYNIIEKITAAKTHKYHVEGTVSTTKTHKYNILEQITTTKTHKYNILQAVTKSTTHKYNIIGFVTSTKTHKYHIEGTVTTTKTHKFNILEKVTTTKTHKYNVQEGLTQVTKSVTHKFNIIAIVQKSVTHKYNLVTQVVKSVTHKYNIIEKITSGTRTHLYNILNAVSRSRTHKYNILELVQRTRTHKYNLGGTVSTTKTHRYIMGGRVITTRTHKYNVGVALTDLQELGGSTHASIRFPERVRVIDIIADIENIVVANVEIITSKPPPHTAIALVAIAEYSGKIRTAETYLRPRHRIASLQILAPIIETIENKAICDYIAIEILPLAEIPTIQARSKTLILQDQSRLHLTSQTQIKPDERTKINIASATALQETPITRIGSLANLQIPYNLSNAIVKIPEIMTKTRAQTLKTLINLLNSDILFE